MGYDLQITRSPDWWDATDKIPFEEWRRVVESDPELEPYDDSPGEDGFKLKGTDFDNFLYYDKRCGTINVRPGLLECGRKAVEIAKKLGAVVQGDEGEFYKLTEDFYESVLERPTPDV